MIQAKGRRQLAECGCRVATSQAGCQITTGRRAAPLSVLFGIHSMLAFIDLLQVLAERDG
jgi:hypothetical protein